MSQYRNGSFTCDGTAQTLELGFVPDKVMVYNLTKLAVNPPNNAEPAESRWLSGMAAASANQTVYTAGAPAVNYITSNGITAFDTGADWDTTQATISGASKANPCVITANSHGFSTGDTVTISGVVGMVQLNTNRYIITVINANSFSLSDLFGNAVDSSSYSTYTSGGIANKISTDATPPGNQYDTGSAGVILGTDVIGATNDVMFWEAWAETPTGW